MNCNKCGYSGSFDDKFCLACGTPFEQVQIASQKQAFLGNDASSQNWGESNSPGWSNQDFNKASFNQHSQPSQASARPVVTGLVLGIVGIFLCALNILIPFVHIVGLAFGITATVLGAGGIRHKAGFAVASMVLGIIGIVFAASMGFIGCMTTRILW